jgi:hypothetical protein
MVPDVVDPHLAQLERLVHEYKHKYECATAVAVTAATAVTVSAATAAVCATEPLAAVRRTRPVCPS